MPQKNYGGAPVGAGYGGVGAGAQGGSKLGSLWDTPSAGAKPAAQPQSLRQQRSGLGSAAGSLRSGRGVPQGGSEDAYAPRPLPSQMGGSYQGHAGGGIDRGGSPASLQQVSSAGSAQDRLKARLWGGAKSTSPGPGSMRSEPPQQQQSSYGGGGGYTSGGRNPYESQGQDKPVMSANSPWASDGGGAGGYGGSQGGYDSRRGGQAGGQRGYR